MSVIYHEVLLALLGHTGDVISAISPRSLKRETKIRGHGFKVSEDLTFLDKSTRSVIDLVCSHGYYYREISHFVDKNQYVRFFTAQFTRKESNGSDLNSDPVEAGRGLYLRALCVGLDEILQEYRCLVLKLEQDILSNPAIPATKLKYMLRKFTILFPPLHNLTLEISGEAMERGEATESKSKYDAEANTPRRERVAWLKGGQILEALHRHAQVGVPEVRKALLRLLFHCHRVLYNQITSFIVHGFLTDPFEEFFIKLQPPAGNQVITDTPSGVSNSSRNPLAQRERVWNTQFTLRPSMLPVSYIPMRFARTVLFIGYAVCLLQHPRIARYIALHYPEEEESLMQREDSNIDGETKGNRLSGRLGGRSTSGFLDLQYRRRRRSSVSMSAAMLLGAAPEFGAGLLPQHALQEFEESLRALANAKVFDAAKAEAELSQMRRTVNRHMCELVVNRGQLIRQLKALKDVFFLARGEFWQTFVEDGASTFFREPTFSKSARTLAERAFAGAAASSGFDADPFFDRFTLYLDEPAFGFQGFSSSPTSTSVDASWQAERDLLGRRSHTTPLRVPGVHQIELCGSARYEGKELLIGAPSSRKPSAAPPGAAYYRFRRKLEDGFTARCSFLLRPPPRGAAAQVATRPLEFALVLQNSSISAIGSGHKGLEGLTNYLAVEFATGMSDTILQVVSKPRKASVGESKELEPVIVHSRQSIPRLRESVRYALRVDYAAGILTVRYHEAVPGSGSKTAGDEKAGGGSVFRVQVSISRVIRLDSGGAWLGLLGGGGGGISISSWSYRGVVRDQGVHAWRHLRLDYRVDPPLDLLVKEKVLADYNSLFSFLFEVKRVQLALQRAWRPLRRRAAFRGTPGRLGSRNLDGNAKERASMLRVWELRHKMQFLVDNLQYYLQVDVLDVAHSELERRVRDATGFEAVARAHTMYLSTLAERCFLYTPVIHRAFRTVFEVCTHFCGLVGVPGAGRLDASGLRRVSGLARDFRLQSTFLFSVLAKTSARGASPHLQQLILRIDYNRSYSREAATSRSAKIGASQR
ncbi:hypothetical protein AAMO2058_000397500 [Amorphochlora amoebiformis]